MFSVTKLDKDSTLVKLLLLESGDLRSTKESESMEDLEETSEMTEENVWTFTEVTTTMVVMLSSGTATTVPTKDGKSSRPRTSRLLSSMSTHQSQMEDCSNSEPNLELIEKLFTSTQPDLEDTVNTGSESEPINHGTGLNGLSSTEELELSDKHTEDNMLSPTNTELRDG